MANLTKAQAEQLLALLGGNTTATPAKAAPKLKAQSFTPVEQVWKGNKTLQITGFPHPFTFGVVRAQAILTHMDAIKAFVAKNPPTE